MKKYLVAFMLMILNTSSAQLEIKKHTINSGGSDAMSGGSFTLKSSIGQVDASSAMTGGTFALSGGFWHTIEPVTLIETIFNNGFE